MPNPTEPTADETLWEVLDTEDLYRAMLRMIDFIDAGEHAFDLARMETDLNCARRVLARRGIEHRFL